MNATGHLSYNKKPATPKSKRSNSPEYLQKSLSRPGSASMINKCLYRLLGEPIKCHGNVSRKIEVLEKKQDVWKEKALAWEKEKKSYCSALESLSKNSADYYKEHLQQWNDSKNFKTGDEGFLAPVVEWIKKQDSNVLKKILDVVGEVYGKSEQEKNMEECLKELAEKNEQLSKSLLKIESELKLKVEGVENLKSKLDRLKSELSEKSSQLLEEKTINEVLLQKITELSNKSHLSELKEELENKDLEIMLLKTQNTQLQYSILQFQQSNEVYVKTIEDLTKKLQSVRVSAYNDENKSFEELSSLEDLDSFDEDQKIVTPEQCENKEIHETFQYFQCMALALEEVLINQRPSYN